MSLQINEKSRFSGPEPNKFFDPRQNVVSVKIAPGAHYVTSANEMITTSLGSCVSACIRDTVLGIGGMNHFMLPGEAEAESEWGGATLAMRYGNNAMETLINDLLGMGGSRNRLEIKLFGGSTLVAFSSEVGVRNVDFVERWLRNEHLAISAKHLGGAQPRRIQFFPATGKVRMQLLESVEAQDVVTQEQVHQRSITDDAVEGDVELF